MCRLLLTAAILFAFCPLAGAKEKSEQAKQLAVAQKAMKRLAFMQGRWGGVETHLPSDYMPKGGSFKAMAKTTSLYKGVHLTVSQTSYTRPVKYEAHGLWSYDAKTQEYVLTWFDSLPG